MVNVNNDDMNLMAGPRGPIRTRLSHKVRSNINTSLIQSRKATIYYIHRDLHDQLIILKV
jgi:hypothetical protein